MKALVKYADGPGNMEIRDMAEPRPSRGQVKIAVAKSGICGSDLHIYHSDIAIPVRTPVVTGHEFSGTVCELGEGVDEWKIGDRVVSETAFSYCGRCSACRAGYYNLCPERKTLGYWYNGSFAPFTIVPADRLHRIPENLSFEEAALVEPLACVAHAVMDLTTIKAEDIVLVSGPGAIGLAALQIASAHGARVIVTGTGIDGERLNLARELGADEVVNVEESSLADLVERKTHGEGADVVLECSGNAQAVNAGLRLLKRRGQFTQIGLVGKSIGVEFELINYRELRVTGSLGSRYLSWQQALSLLSSGAVRARPLISHILPMKDWERAFQMFENKQGLKLVLDPLAA